MQDASTRRFQRNVVSNWNLAVGSVCLMLMSAILVVFAWQVGQARRQDKSWCVCYTLLELLPDVVARICCSACLLRRPTSLQLPCTDTVV